VALEALHEEMRARDADRAAAAVSLHIHVPQTSMEQIPDEIFDTMDTGPEERGADVLPA
jgi:hypothetical protein